MATTTTTSKVTLKLLVDKKGNRVLFAEAGKEFVDFLFTLLSFPLGTVIRLLSKNQMVGCLGNLYQSIEELSDAFIQPSQSKDSVLNPRSPFQFVGNTLLLTDDNSSRKAAAKRKLYMCSNSQNHRTVSDSPVAICPSCSNRSYSTRGLTRGLYAYGEPAVDPTMNLEATFVETAGATSSTTVVNKNGGESGFVKGVVTYMVMDNLEVKPMSTISSITLLNKFNIQDVGSLEEKVVELGMDEGLKLLKASLQTKTVLTSVFLA
ncbi:hypothetical protein LINPERHAP2_LOCUS6158 [Linum perenne]